MQSVLTLSRWKQLYSRAPLKTVSRRDFKSQTEPPQIRRDYPLNLSLSISGGKETNRDSLSKGEQRWKSFAPNRTEIKVDRNDIKRIITDLQDEIPRSLSAIGLLKNVLEGRVVCKLHTDSWPSFNTMVCEVIYPRVSEVADLLCYSRGSGEEMLKLLQLSNVISWGKRQQIFHIESELSEYLEENLFDPSTGSRVLSSCEESVVAYGFPKKLTPIPCPDGFTFGHLYGKHTSLVTKHLWKFQDWPRVNSYYKSLISSFENRAIYSNDNMDSPVAWIVQYPFGRAGGLHTLKEYRDKHFGTLLSLEMSKVMESRGFMTWSITDSTATRKIMANMGLSESESRVKCLVTCKL
ncbi:glycine N-acyltransferase-like [Halichondria panicea]|uniref:glycine N-acyltransferase-like n=1 Tax=Halichondria panicea TaxID=6063 RepID=UPI00312B69B9